MMNINATRNNERIVSEMFRLMGFVLVYVHLQGICTEKKFSLISVSENTDSVSKELKGKAYANSF